MKFISKRKKKKGGKSDLKVDPGYKFALILTCCCCCQWPPKKNNTVSLKECSSLSCAKWITNIWKHCSCLENFWKGVVFIICFYWNWKNYFNIQINIHDIKNCSHHWCACQRSSFFFWNVRKMFNVVCEVNVYLLLLF